MTRLLRMRGILPFCVASLVLFARDPYGRVTGRVVDSAAAAIPGVSTRVTNVETRVTTNAGSDSAGNYEARNLIPGQYTISAESRGFKRYLRGPVEVRVGDCRTCAPFRWPCQVCEPTAGTTGTWRSTRASPSRNV